jgi:nucleoside-diphosphate-sugar epimerase
MILLVGGNGFVGSAYARLFNQLGLLYEVVTRTNAATFRYSQCDVLINANGNSKKFLADREPLAEFDASVRSVAETVEWFKPSLYVHLSTGDVYPDQSSPLVTQEDQSIDVTRISRYGLHKYVAEQIVQGTQERWLIFRMGGFVGPGLKKNAIFDMMRGDPVWLAPSSRLQFINIDHAAEIVWTIATNSSTNQIINLGAAGTVHLGDLHARVCCASEFRPGAPEIVYELSTEKLRQLYGKPLPHSLDEVSRFLGDAAADEGREKCW